MGSLWNYEENERKLNPTKDSDSNENVDVDLDALEEDKLDVAEDEVEEEEEVEGETEEKEEVVEKPEKVKADETGLTATQQQAVKDQVLKIVGPDAILKVKGIEKKASDLTPQEMTVYLQKGMNADRLFQEHAAAKKQVDSERETVRQSALALQEYMKEHPAGRTGSQSGLADGSGYITKLPDYLKPHPDDTPEVQQWKESQVQMLDEFNAMKRYVVGNAQQAVDQKKVDDVVALRDTYPMASIDEVLAVKSVRPNVDSEELMRASHNYYSGTDFMKKAMTANPTFKREYDAEVIKSYLAKKGGAPKIPGKKARGSSIEKVSFGGERKNVKGTFEDADKLSRQYLHEVDKMEKES